jgi:mRNA interferase MazF
VNAFTPAEGDIVWLEFDPQVGHEQAGHRPALVLTPERYNAMRGMMLCCPMTTKVKG